MKSENLNLLEPSGPVQAFNGIALPFLLTTIPQAQLTFLCSIIFYPDCECFGYIARQEEINLSIEWN